jgi:hypothetical protein
LIASNLRAIRAGMRPSNEPSTHVHLSCNFAPTDRRTGNQRHAAHVSRDFASPDIHTAAPV